ncbi:MAG: NADPH:quinone oxidoreductase family protein [candidate division NC10 bacterium]|nr:NADPH:quinone oxidoreductase family protein [candidate division NC10 bacterium]
MKAIRVHQHGEPEVLRYEEVPDPTPEPGEVLVQVRAAGVNFADALARRGLYPTLTPPPFIPGIEVAGTVVAVGAGVEGIEVGQRVMGFAPKAGYAELAVMPAAGAMPVPERINFEEAAAFPIVFLTAYHALKTFGRLQEGEAVLIHAAGGGVGTAAVQLAKIWGGRVFATAGSDGKLSKVRTLGADIVHNYRTGDFLDAVRRWTGGRGVDVVLESVGGEVFEKSLRALAPDGRLVVVGLSSGVQPQLHLGLVIMNRLSVIGMHLGSMTVKRPDLVGTSARELIGLLAQGMIKPVVGHVFPLKEAAEAHRLLEGRGSYGKLVLKP